MGARCSVIVCTRDRPGALAACLASLRALRHPSFEVVVVDNGEGAFAAAAEAGARYVHEPVVGLSRARNRGALAAEGAIIAFLDDDCIADPDWLSNHEAAMHADVAVTTGRILPVGGEGPASAPLDLGERGFVVDRATPDWFELANFGGLGFGGNVAFRRRVFERGLRFDEALGVGSAVGGGEEAYALFRVIAGGGRVAYAPGAIVFHRPETGPSGQAGELAGARRHGAYVAFLLARANRYRMRLLRHALEAVRGRPRAWRPPGTARTVPRWRSLAAGLNGAAQYVALSVLGKGRTS